MMIMVRIMVRIIFGLIAKKSVIVMKVLTMIIIYETSVGLKNLVADLITVL